MILLDKKNRRKTLACISAVFIVIGVVQFIFILRPTLGQSPKCFLLSLKNAETKQKTLENSIKNPFQEFQGFSDNSDSIYIFLRDDTTRSELELILNKLADLNSYPIGADSSLPPTIQVTLPPCVEKDKFSKILKTLQGVDMTNTCPGWCPDSVKTH